MSAEAAAGIGQAAASLFQVLMQQQMEKERYLREQEAEAKRQRLQSMYAQMDLTGKQSQGQQDALRTLGNYYAQALR